MHPILTKDMEDFAAFKAVPSDISLSDGPVDSETSTPTGAAPMTGIISTMASEATRSQARASTRSPDSSGGPSRLSGNRSSGRISPRPLSRPDITHHRFLPPPHRTHSPYHTSHANTRPVAPSSSYGQTYSLVSTTPPRPSNYTSHHPYLTHPPTYAPSHVPPRSYFEHNPDSDSQPPAIPSGYVAVPQPYHHPHQPRYNHISPPQAQVESPLPNQRTGFVSGFEAAASSPFILDETWQEFVVQLGF